MKTPHTIVVGGGVIGVATAYYLADRGHRVTLLEQNETCSGSSQGNAGQITPAHLALNQPGTIASNLGMLLKPASPLFVPLRPDLSLLGWLLRFQRACGSKQVERTTQILIALGRCSLEMFEQLTSEFEFGYENRGRLDICRDPKTLPSMQHEADMLRGMDYPSETLTADEVRAREPSIGGPIAGGVFYPMNSHCNPHRFVLELAAAAERKGVEIRAHTPVTEVRIPSDGRVVIDTPNGSIEANGAVLACGAWAPRLVRRFGLRLPVQPGKGYHLDIDTPAASPTIPLALVEDRMVVTPIDNFLRFAGTMELSGFNLKRREKRIEMLAVGAARYFADIDRAKVRSRWCHLRPMSPDGLPIIGPLPGTPHVWLATGHGMLGLTQGPITGKLVADGMTGERPSIDLAPLRPDRF